MIDHDKSLRSTGGEWMGWPTQLRPNDIRQCALAVIATTRHEWASGRSPTTSADETGISRGRFEYTVREHTPTANNPDAEVARPARKRFWPCT
jgi:hypothetical protein